MPQEETDESKQAPVFIDLTEVQYINTKKGFLGRIKGMDTFADEITLNANEITEMSDAVQATAQQLGLKGDFKTSAATLIDTKTCGRKLIRQTRDEVKQKIADAVQAANLATLAQAVALVEHDQQQKASAEQEKTGSSKVNDKRFALGAGPT